MTIFAIEPISQNYSSMYREAVTAQEAKTGMEITHHRMAAFYFGIAALESFLNLRMRDHLLRSGKQHGEIHKILHDEYLKEKIKEWPTLIIGSPLSLRKDSIAQLLSLNALRGNLTHQKNFWPDTFRELGRTDPMRLVDLVAEFIIEFHRANGEFFPYWILGWNYLNPRRNAHDIALLNNVQFMHSLNYLGYKSGQGIMHDPEAFQKRVMASYEGYIEVAGFLRSCNQCEPKIAMFPYQPKLCRRWWDTAHHRTCGNVTEEAVRRSIEIDAQFGKPRINPGQDVKASAASSLMKRISGLFGRK